MVLVDSSAWIAYFKGNDAVRPLTKLIESNSVCVNDMILAELIPSIIQKGEEKLVDLFHYLSKVDLVINWDRIIEMQTKNLMNGLNRIGISDLIIAQNAIDNDLELYTLDKHFILMSEIHQLNLYC